MKRDAVKTSVAVLVVLVALVVPAVHAATGAVAGAQPPAAGQGGDFVPVKDLPAQETIPAAPLVMAAYAFVWAALLLYVWTVWRRLIKVEREIKDLSARLTMKPGRP